MMGCIEGVWELHCSRDYTDGYHNFRAGETYKVKDKFPGVDGELESGIWEVKDGKGGLVNISRECREKYF